LDRRNGMLDDGFVIPNLFENTQLYAARLESKEGERLPLAWEWHNKDAPGVYQIDYY